MMRGPRGPKGGAKPQNMKATVSRLMGYVGRYRLRLLLVLLCILGNKHMRSHLRRAKPPPFCKKFPVFNLPNLYIYIYPVKQWLTNSGIIILYLSGSAGAFRHVGITAARAWIRWNTELDTI